MIVQESDILSAALDRRLQVDRILALDPLKAVATAAPDSGPSTGPTSVRSSPMPQVADRAAGPNPPSTPIDRLPLGAVVGARVVDVPDPGHVVAEIGTLRVALAWPSGSGEAPTPGSEIGLRVLAHRPMLLLQRVEAVADHEAFEPTTHWSADALRLQGGATDRPATDTSGIVRFEVPILELDDGPDPPAPGRGESSTTPRAAAMPDGGAGLPTAASPHVGSDGPALASIALADVIVAREAAVVDGVTTPLVPRAADDGDRSTLPFMPLVLQGPAWNGQPVELVVRRERADEQFDNAALDRWCGELLIDLPQLGRIAGHVTWSMQGLRIRLEGDDDAAIDAMEGGSAALATALSQVDLRVCALSVGGLAADSRHANDAVHPSSAAVSFGRLPS